MLWQKMPITNRVLSCISYVLSYFSSMKFWFSFPKEKKVAEGHIKYFITKINIWVKCHVHKVTHVYFHSSVGNIIFNSLRICFQTTFRLETTCGACGHIHNSKMRKRPTFKILSIKYYTLLGVKITMWLDCSTVES